jgi:hypothetical protein
VKPIFAYIEDFDKKQIERVRRAGYLPLKVLSLENFKIVLPLPTHCTNEITKAAMEAVLSSNLAPDVFGKKVAKIMSK